MRFFVNVAAVVAVLSLASCETGTGEPVPGPSGKLVQRATCNGSPDRCLKSAAAQCKGPYQVLDSSSNSGGLIADIIPGPVTWYRMSYQCGPSDGKMPTFAFRGQSYNPPPVYVQSPQPRNQTNCTITPHSTFVGGAPSSYTTSCE